MNDAILTAAQNLGVLLRESEEFTLMQEKEVDALLDNELQGQYREYALSRQNLQEAEMQPERDEDAIEKLRMEITRLESELQEAWGRHVEREHLTPWYTGGRTVETRTLTFEVKRD